jgi:hypothetical protein
LLDVANSYPRVVATLSSVGGSDCVRQLEATFLPYCPCTFD